MKKKKDGSFKRSGGSRVNAGRKPLEIPTKKVTFSVRYDLVKQLKEMVKEWKTSN